MKQDLKKKMSFPKKKITKAIKKSVIAARKRVTAANLNTKTAKQTARAHAEIVRGANNTVNELKSVLSKVDAARVRAVLRAEKTLEKGLGIVERMSAKLLVSVGKPKKKRKKPAKKAA